MLVQQFQRRFNTDPGFRNFGVKQAVPDIRTVEGRPVGNLAEELLGIVSNGGQESLPFPGIRFQQAGLAGQHIDLCTHLSFSLRSPVV